MAGTKCYLVVDSGKDVTDGPSTYSVFRRVDTGEEKRLSEFGPGAMWDAHWMHDVPDWCGPDGKCIVVRLPDGTDWHIDGRASNCTMPKDNKHRCWVRHGDPPNLTVDKNGVTCKAGAGSIQTKHYHGFLRDGVLTKG